MISYTGVGVNVGENIGVGVIVNVGVCVFVIVGVKVGVGVNVGVDVGVGVSVGVGVGRAILKVISLEAFVSKVLKIVIRRVTGVSSTFVRSHSYIFALDRMGAVS